MRGRDPIGVEHADSVGDEVGALVLGSPRLVRDRAACVAMVVADHEPAAFGQHPAEALLPPEHRPTDTHHQEDCGIGLIAEGLSTKLDAVRFDYALGQLRSP
jgi:hypothetical protein